MRVMVVLLDWEAGTRDVDYLPLSNDFDRAKYRIPTFRSLRNAGRGHAGTSMARGVHGIGLQRVSNARYRVNIARLYVIDGFCGL